MGQAQMLVAVLDGASSAPVAGFSCGDTDPITRTGPRIKVTWRGQSNLAVLKGKTIRLQFHFIHASLRAFQILAQ